MAKWIVRDNWNATERDREQLLDYLSMHQITPHPSSFLQEVVGSAGDNWVDAWRYLSYAVQAYPSHPSVQRKLKKLTKEKRDIQNDVLQHRQNRIDWRGALLEFKALYALTRSFGYQFEGFDGKAPSASGEQDCDLVLRCERKKTQFAYADARAWCYDLRTQVPGRFPGSHSYNPLPKADPVNTYSRLEDGVPTDMEKVGRWLEDQLEDVRAKGADILVCDLPEWQWEDLDPGYLRAYCDEILPGKLQWQSDGPVWGDSVPVTTVEKIVVVRRIGCWSIALKNSKAG